MEKMASKSRGAGFRAWFQRYGLITVFIPALMPIPMPLKLFVVSAGVLGTKRSSFLLVILVARVLRYFGEAWLGVTLGRQSTRFLTTHVWQFVSAAAALFALLYLVASLYGRRARVEAEVG